VRSVAAMLIAAAALVTEHAGRRMLYDVPGRTATAATAVAAAA
jgi:hypothetical protein